MRNKIGIAVAPLMDTCKPITVLFTVECANPLSSQEWRIADDGVESAD
jgi:hypothetical protein